jgi:hypothetical protein
MCLFNKGNANGKARDLLVHCNGCHNDVCKSCIKQLRVCALKEIKRCSWFKLVKHDVLQWLLCTPLERLFDVASSNTVLVAPESKRTRISFREQCIFCFDAQLPLRRALLERLPKEMGYPFVQPLRGVRKLFIIQVSSPIGMPAMTDD